MKDFKTSDNDYVSPVSEVIGLIYEGAVLTASDVDLGFEFEDGGDMPPGEDYEIGG